MAQVTLELDQKTIRQMKAAAQRSGVSLNHWVAQLVRTRTADVWPADVIRLSGAWADAPTLEELRSSEVADVPREPF